VKTGAIGIKFTNEVSTVTKYATLNVYIFLSVVTRGLTS